MTSLRPFAVNENLYPFEERWFTRKNIRLHYVDDGDGPPVVFFHGSPSWSFLYRDVMRGVDGARVLAADMLGFGMSDKPDGFDYGPQSQAQWLSAWLRELDLPPFVAVVQDWGGPIGLTALLDHIDNLRGLVVLNTWAWPPGAVLRGLSFVLGGPVGRAVLKWAPSSLMRGSMATAEEKAEEVFDSYAAPFARSSEGPMTLQRSIRQVDAWLSELESNLSRYSHLPVELVWGTQDRGFGDEKTLARWTAHFPNAKVTRLTHASHFLQEDDPDAIAAAVNRILQRSAAQSGNVDDRGNGASH